MAFPLGLSLPHWHAMMNAGIVQHGDRFFRQPVGYPVKESDDVLARYRLRHRFPGQARFLLQTAQRVEALLVPIRATGTGLPPRLQPDCKGGIGLNPASSKKHSAGVPACACCLSVSSCWPKHAA
jgi:hypothetical protein